jgi:hypothetical protein
MGGLFLLDLNPKKGEAGNEDRRNTATNTKINFTAG